MALAQEMEENKSLNIAWKAAHLEKLDTDEEICLPEICDEIGQWMHRDRHPHSRRSLRTFSVLLSGATRIYERQLNRLLIDTIKCSQLTPVIPVILSSVGEQNTSDTIKCSQLTPVIPVILSSVGEQNTSDCSEEETRQSNESEVN